MFSTACAGTITEAMSAPGAESNVDADSGEGSDKGIRTKQPEQVLMANKSDNSVLPIDRTEAFSWRLPVQAGGPIPTRGRRSAPPGLAPLPASRLLQIHRCPAPLADARALP